MGVFFANDFHDKRKISDSDLDLRRSNPVEKCRPYIQETPEITVIHAFRFSANPRSLPNAYLEPYPWGVFSRGRDVGSSSLGTRFSSIFTEIHPEGATKWWKMSIKHGHRHVGVAFPGTRGHFRATRRRRWPTFSRNPNRNRALFHTIQTLVQDFPRWWQSRSLRLLRFCSLKVLDAGARCVESCCGMNSILLVLLYVAGSRLKSRGRPQSR